MKAEKFSDRIYNIRKLLIKYFICAIILSALRSFVSVLLKGVMSSGYEFSAWVIWAIVLFPCLKYFVFKQKSANIYALLRQIIIYIICITVLWYGYSFFVSIFFAIFRSPAPALTLGGMAAEVLCAYLMIKFAFKNKK